MKNTEFGPEVVHLLKVVEEQPIRIQNQSANFIIG